MTGKFLTLVFLGFTTLALPLSGCGTNNTTSSSCVDQRFATVGWDIVTYVNNLPVTLSCDQANASSVVLYFGPYTYEYPCTDYQGTTDNGLPPGNYATSMQLLSPSRQVLSDTAIPNGPSSFPIYACAPDDIVQTTLVVQ